MAGFKVGDRVIVDGDSDLIGSIGKVRLDDRSNAIYIVLLDNNRATEDGLYIARDCELELIPESGPASDKDVNDLTDYDLMHKEREK